MIISRTPYRVGLVGGGTDLAEFANKEGGAVVNCAIDKYVYVMVTKNFHGVWKVSYSKTEYANTVDEIVHPTVREVLRYLRITEPLDILTASDMPSGSGIGSSSSFTVGLLNALFTYKGHSMSKGVLAQLACHVEIDMVKDVVGKQDQYAAAYGGFNYMEFNVDGTVTVQPVRYKHMQAMMDNLLMVYAGNTRQSGVVQSEVVSTISTKMPELRRMKRAAEVAHSVFKMGCTPACINECIEEDWLIKKTLAGGISNPVVDALIKHGLDNGALGCKLMGAGGGGFLLFYCEQDKQEQFVQAFPNNQVIRFGVDYDGSKIVYKE